MLQAPSSFAGSTFTSSSNLGLAPTPASFTGPTNFAAGDGPVSVAVGDFDGGGDPDLAVANEFAIFSGSVSALLGGAGASFGAATSFLAGFFPISVALGNFNGDSDPDLAVANTGSSDVSVLLGGPGGGFGAATNFPVGSFASPVSVAVGDFNGDGRRDLAVANLDSDNVSVLLGTGTGSFEAATTFAAGDGPSSVAVGDFNADGKPDLALANVNSDNVSVLVNSTDRAPTATNDAYTVAEDTPMTVAAPGVLANDTDPDGDTLSAALASGPSRGSLTLNPNGSFAYTPTPSTTAATASPTAPATAPRLPSWPR